MRLSLRGAARVGLAALIVAISGYPVLAQSTSARVEGVVSDNTGAAVPGATVTATNTETNVAKSVVSDGEGRYVLTPLPGGSYKIQAELTGFKPQAASAVLNVNQVARLDFKLEVGTMSESVDVTATAPVIEKSTSYIGTVIDKQQVANLPLNGRNFTQLTTLSPGVTRGTPGSAAAGQGGQAETFRYGEFGGTSISVNGLREQFNTYLYDGIDNNESLVNGIAYVPSPEVIQEFRVITTNAPAEFGRAGGAIQNIISKSGTNALHGTAYYYGRPRGMASTPAFSSEKPEFSNKDFGGTFGGPLVKDKTFYFLSYHGLRNSLPVNAGNKVTVPTDRMRNGDFSELLDPANTGLGQPVIIYDPVTGQPFPGNIIPSNRFNPVGQAFLNVYPHADQPGVLRNYLTHRQKNSTYDDADGRIDHNFSGTDVMFLRGSFWADKFEDPGNIPGFQAGFGSGTSRNKGYQIGLGETHTFSPNVINELRVGYMDFRFEFLPVSYGTNQNDQLGIGGPGGINVDNGISLIGGGDGRYIEYLGDFGQYQIKQKTMQLSDAVTWIHGQHAFKFGGTAMQRRMFQTRTQVGKGFYFFRDSFGFDPGYTGYEVADMLIGKSQWTATGNPGYVPREVINWENSIYAQDDWRVNRKLTLNLGLRYDLFTPYYEKDDKLANFDPATNSLVVPGQNGVPRSTVDTDKNNFGPRIGFAYQLNEKTALRGSYGLFYTLDRGGIDNQLTENPPAVVTQYRFSGPLAPRSLDQIIPLPDTIDPNNPSLPDGSGIVYVPRDSKTTSVDQFSVSAQRELDSKTAFMLAYVGTRGHNMAAKLTSAGFSGQNVADRLTTLKYIGRSTYDGMQTTIRRNSPELSVLASYTLSWSKDNIPSLYPGGASRGVAITDPNDLDKDFGYADYDSRHRFTLAATYLLPFAKEDRFLGGWSVNGVFTFQSGTPFTVYSGNSRAVINGDINYPKTEVKNPDGSLSYVQWVDPASFSAPASGTQGAERNSVRGPGVNTIDLSLFKTFKIHKNAGLEIRVEGFNIFDQAQYNLPNQSLDDPNFGRITGTRLNTERQFQLAARFSF